MSGGPHVFTFVDGKSLPGPQPFQTLDFGSEPLMISIGWADVSRTSHAFGDIGDVELFPRALTRDEVASIAAADSVPGAIPLNGDSDPSENVYTFLTSPSIVDGLATADPAGAIALLDPISRNTRISNAMVDVIRTAVARAPSARTYFTLYELRTRAADGQYFFSHLIVDATLWSRATDFDRILAHWAGATMMDCHDIRGPRLFTVLLAVFQRDLALRAHPLRDTFLLLLKRLAFPALADDDSIALFILCAIGRDPDTASAYLEILTDVNATISPPIIAKFQPSLLFMLCLNLPELFPKIIAALAGTTTFDPTLLAFLDVNDDERCRTLAHLAANIRPQFCETAAFLALTLGESIGQSVGLLTSGFANHSGWFLWPTLLALCGALGMSHRWRDSWDCQHRYATSIALPTLCFTLRHVIIAMIDRRSFPPSFVLPFLRILTRGMSPMWCCVSHSVLSFSMMHQSVHCIVLQSSKLSDRRRFEVKFGRSSLLHPSKSCCQYTVLLCLSNFCAVVRR
jgi:hypothetical protein